MGKRNLSSFGQLLCFSFYQKLIQKRNIGKKFTARNVSTTPITAMGCRQCLSLRVVQLKGKHCRKPNCNNGVVDTFGLYFPTKYLFFVDPYTGQPKFDQNSMTTSFLFNLYFIGSKSEVTLTTGAMHPKAELCIFMGKTDPNAAKHRVRFIYLFF